ncbi:MAG: right-handed parallel beta-helix repeat-containing protein [candidate division WOR-3 bacterium]|nr:MAG: right-handed parallel beta-helix repeat-containing protein [candidate division WOR-3 bacterium]
MKHIRVFIVAIALLLVTRTAHATIWYVHPDSTLNCIQDCLDSCANGDTVSVGPGVYYENIVWPNVQGIHLVSELGPDTTIIDGGSTGRVIQISTGTDSATLISGFTVRNGYLTGIYDHGAGILCENSSPTITNNIITGNRVGGAAFGGGIVCLGNSSPTITGNVVSENGGGAHDGVRGGGIACCDSSAPFIAENTVSGNYATVAGGGIYCFGNAMPTITGNVIADNATGECMCGWIGGGIACDYRSAPVITANTITGNYANFGGGIGCDSSEPFIDDNNITGNTGYCGGGIHCQGSSSTISNNTVSNDTAVWDGGGIYCYQASPTFTGNIVSENVIPLTGFGGGMVCDGSSPVVSGCIILGNYGNGIYCQPDVWGNHSSPEIHHNDICDNVGYGICNIDTTVMVSADSNWWGDETGPYHPAVNPAGLGDSVSDYVDFVPWLTAPIGIEELPIVGPVDRVSIGATIFRGSLQLPEGKKCKVFDITGRSVEPRNIAPGIYFLEVDNKIVQKVVKVR